MENLLKLIALILALFFLFMYFFKIYVKQKTKKMEGKQLSIIEDGLVYFYSERCGACRIMKPEIEKLKGKIEVLEIDVEKPEGFKFAKEYGIMATPTILLVKDGIIKRVFVGFIRHEEILKEV